MNHTLYYVLDPMCSWCWGFRPIFEQLLAVLPEDIPVCYVMGGLAADSDQAMPEETQAYIQQQWRLVSEQTGAEFNWEFWNECQPRRSTYPSCRAVIAAGQQGASQIPAMIFAIQKAYYLQARNPSDTEILLKIANEIDLDINQFEHDLGSAVVENRLQQDFQLRRQLNVRSFPTVLITTADKVIQVAQGNCSIEQVRGQIEQAIGKLLL